VELRARGLAESTVRIAYDILLAILETALRDGALGRNPVAAVKRPRFTRHEASYLTPDQVRAVLSAAEGTRYAPLFTLLVNTGLRRGEALAAMVRRRPRGWHSASAWHAGQSQWQA
jgi:integrase